MARGNQRDKAREKNEKAKGNVKARNTKSGTATQAVKEAADVIIRRKQLESQMKKDAEAQAKLEEIRRQKEADIKAKQERGRQPSKPVVPIMAPSEAAAPGKADAEAAAAAAQNASATGDDVTTPKTVEEEASQGAEEANLPSDPTSATGSDASTGIQKLSLSSETSTAQESSNPADETKTQKQTAQIPQEQTS